METLGIILLVAGSVLSIIGSIWFLIVTFQESVLWGLGCMLIPFVSLFFLVAHWEDAASPFWLSVLGTLITLMAVFLMPGSFC